LWIEFSFKAITPRWYPLHLILYPAAEQSQRKAGISTPLKNFIAIDKTRQLSATGGSSGVNPGNLQVTAFSKSLILRIICTRF
jgi:hypothetical protein